MIEVTDEMVDAAALAFTEKPTEATYVVARRMLNAAIKLHEQNKTKPEPVGYIYKRRLEQMLESAVDNGCNFFPIKDNIPKAIFDRHRDKYLALYTTPPTQEPLSEEQIRKAISGTNDMVRNTMHGVFWPELEQACRAIEQAHGIGVTNA